MMLIVKVLRTFCLVAFVAVLQLSVWGCKKSDTTKAPTKPVTSEVLAVPTLLGTLADDEKPDTAPGDAKHAKAPTAEKQPAYIVVEMDKRGRGFAYIARVKDGVHVVHNKKTGTNYKEVDSSTLTVSPDGQRVAYCAKATDKWLVVVDGKEYGPFDDKGPPVFSPDSKHVAFEAQLGASWHVFVDGAKSEGVASYYDKPLFSPDSTRLIRRENTPEETSYRMVFSDLSFKEPITVSLSSLANTVSEDFSRIAVADRTEGKYQVKLFTTAQPDKPVLGAVYDDVRGLAFSKDAQHLAYVAKRGKNSYLVLDDREEAIPEGLYPWPPVIRPDGKGVGLVIVGSNGAYIHQAFLDNNIRMPAQYKECADLAYSPDGASHAYVAIRNERFLIVSNNVEGPMYDRVIGPLFSPDGRYLIYRARQDGKRFVVVADPQTGKVIKEHPRYERVFDPVFTTDGPAVAYGVKDGNQLWWKVEKLP